MPISAGTVKNLRVNMGTATSKSGDSITIYKDGAATAVTCVFGNASSCSDTTHSFTVVAGDVITIFTSITNGSGAANISVAFELWN